MNAKICLTKKQALAEARKQVSRLTRFSGGWSYMTFDPAANAWRESQPVPRHVAARRRSIAIASRVADERGLNGDDKAYRWERMSREFPTLASMLADIP